MKAASSRTGHCESKATYQIGRQLQRLGQFAAAAEKYLRVVDLDASRIAPFLRLFECETRTKDAETARQSLRKRLSESRPRGFATTVGDAGLKLASRFDGEFHFQASSLESLDPRVRHVRTRWEIREVDGQYRRDCVFDWLSDSALESLTLPADRLRPNTRYRWRVTYQFWPGTQEVSAESTLQPQSYQQHTSPFDLQPYFNADVISNPGDPANDAVDGDEDAFAAVAPDDTLFQRQHVGVHQLGHHTELNAIQLTDRHKTSITISAPTARRFDAIRILMTSGWKEADLPMRIVYADGSSQAVEIHCEDWEHQPEDGMDRDPYFFGKDFVPLLRVAGVRASGNRRPGMAIFEANFATDPERELASIVLEPASMTGHSPRVEFPSRLNILAITGIRNDPSDDELCRCVVD